MRDGRLPTSRRYVALRSAVTLFSPNGFNATFANLASQVGAPGVAGMWTDNQLVAAADLLTQSRNHYLAQSSEWHTSRRENKRNGTRLATEVELVARNSPSWFDSVSTGTRRPYHWVTLTEWARRLEHSPPPFGTLFEEDLKTVRDAMKRGHENSERNFLAHYGPFQRHLVPANLISIPYRVDAEPLSDSVYGSLSATQKSIADCLYSRSYDGRTRQRHARRIVELEEAWVIPYVVAALGDYVVEVVKEVATGLSELSQDNSWQARKYRLFAEHNADLLRLVGQQAASYWDCYYSHEFTLTSGTSDRPRYPAMAVLESIGNDYPTSRFRIP